MPHDNRRFNGPEDSISYQRFTKDFVKTYDELFAELLDDNGIRKDGRTLEEARSQSILNAQMHAVSQAKGSAYVEMGKTKVVCAVFDPREIPHQNKFNNHGDLFCEVKFAPFACKGERRSVFPDAEAKELSVAMKQALEPAVCRYTFPNFQIDIFVYILENDGGCLSTVINCAGLALTDAAVPMHDIITSVSLAIIRNQVFIDPNHDEEKLALANINSDTNYGVVTLSWLPGLNQVSEFRLVGSIDMEWTANCLGILENECEKLSPIIRQVITSNVEKHLEENKELEEEQQHVEDMFNEKIEEFKQLLK